MQDTNQLANIPLSAATELAQQGSSPVSRLPLVMGAIVLTILPCVTTFGEFLCAYRSTCRSPHVPGAVRVAGGGAHRAGTPGHFSLV